ncbi:hypothetical protein CGQ24_08290 [Arthrobacter sp. 7749]|nr:hypothetical protein CGQ24_08290 [Arthrobacter sp. 7749]
MTKQEKDVTKALRRHQRDGRRFRDLLIHCACGWKSPELKARKGSNDFAAAREDQAKSFERHVTRAIIEAAGTPADDSTTGKFFDLKVKVKGDQGEATVGIAVSGTDNIYLACIALHEAAKPGYLSAIISGFEDPGGWEDA